MTIAEAIGKVFLDHTSVSARMLGLHVRRSHLTSRLELRNALTGQRITISERIPNSAIDSAAAEAMEAVTNERRRLAELQQTAKRGPQMDCGHADRAHVQHA